MTSIKRYLNKTIKKIVEADRKKKMDAVQKAFNKIKEKYGNQKESNLLKPEAKASVEKGSKSAGGVDGEGAGDNEGEGA